MDSRQLQVTVAAAKAGSFGAYEALLGEYGPRLYGYFLKAVGNHHSAEDLLGEIVLKLVRELKTYDDRGRFDHWLFRIAANLVRDCFRRIKTRPHIVSLSGQDDQERSLADQIAQKRPAVDSRLAAEEISARLNEAMSQLDPTTRQMILLRHFADMSFKEIAEVFDCPLGTALSRVHRGLKALRRILGEEYGSD